MLTYIFSSSAGYLLVVGWINLLFLMSFIPCIATTYLIYKTKVCTSNIYENKLICLMLHIAAERYLLHKPQRQIIPEQYLYWIRNKNRCLHTMSKSWTTYKAYKILTTCLNLAVEINTVICINYCNVLYFSEFSTSLLVYRLP